LVKAIIVIVNIGLYILLIKLDFFSEVHTNCEFSKGGQS